MREFDCKIRLILFFHKNKKETENEKYNENGEYKKFAQKELGTNVGIGRYVDLIYTLRVGRYLGIISDDAAENFIVGKQLDQLVSIG